MGQSGYGIGILVASVIASLLIGWLFAANLVQPEIVEKQVVVTQDKIVYVDVPKEVTKEVKVEVNNIGKYLDDAVAEFLKEVEDEDNLQKCDGDRYEFDEIKVAKVYDSWTYENKDNDDGKYEVSAKVRLNYKQADISRCSEPFEFTVAYEDDEKPEVSID